MSIINEIKCARCDRKYSGVRSRCPYCGARRIGRGKYSEDSDNAKGKMLISVLIMAVFTVAAGILLFTTPVDADAQTPVDDPGISSPEDDIIQEPGILPEPSPEIEEPEPEEPVAPPVIESIIITYGGNRREDFAVKIGEMVPLRVKVEPPGIDFRAEWSSSDEEIFQVVAVDIRHEGAEVTGIGVGTAFLTVKVGDLEETIPVYGMR